MTRTRRTLANAAGGLGAVVLAIAAGLASQAAAAPADGWAAYRGDVHGFMLRYPGAVFKELEGGTDRAGDKLALVSRDGRARLLAEAFWNQRGESLAAYRARLLTEIYPGAVLDYAPTRNTWFVVSGVKDGQMFYHRTTFTCGGRLISSWAMAYPVAERRFYDRIVEGIARQYSAARGPNGDCRTPVAMGHAREMPDRDPGRR